MYSIIKRGLGLIWYDADVFGDWGSSPFDCTLALHTGYIWFKKQLAGWRLLFYLYLSDLQYKNIIT